MKNLFLIFLLGITSYTYSQSLDYVVERKGKQIGTHSFVFNGTQNDEMLVQISTDVVVKLGFIPVYKFIHEGTEIWKKGILTGYDSTTNDNGTDKFLRFHDNSIHSSRGVFSSLEKTYMPASLWNISNVQTTQLMNTLDGSIMNIEIVDLGEEDIQTTGKKILKARHFSMTGDLARELWYDSHNRLVHVQFLGDDGSIIDYILDE